MLAPEQVSPLRLRPLKRVEYEQLVDLGVFEDERIELLRGALVEMSPQKSPQAHAVGWLAHRLTLALGDRALVRCQLPLAISDDSEPEPDIAVVPRESYIEAHPTTAHLIIEVADSSRRKDRDVKASVYAEARVPDYWIVDLVERVVEVLRVPVDGAYTSQERVSTGGRVSPLRFPDVEVVVDEILPNG